MTSYYGRRRSYRRRKGYSRSTSRRLSHVVSPFWESLQFVRTEFFRMDPFTFKLFSNFYADKYGDGPKRYMQRTYPKWKSGVTDMSGQTAGRILQCVPPFLDREKQFELLSFQVPAVVQQQKAELNATRIRTSKLESTYHGMASSIAERQYKLNVKRVRTILSFVVPMC